MSRRDLGFCLHGMCQKPRDQRSRSYCTEHFDMREAKKKEAEERSKRRLEGTPASTTTEEGT